MGDLPRLYRDLASWFHLLTDPTAYAEEAAIFLEVMNAAASVPVRRMLELGSGGGNNASHLKDRVVMTLTDLSPEMLAESERINPECRHVVGDMRSLRLGERFDAVFAHDAVSYLMSMDDLTAVAVTAREHLVRGGVVLLVPDEVAESFTPKTSRGGHDRDDRGMRYLEWRTGPFGDAYRSDMAYLLRVGDAVTVAQDEHLFGLFAISRWLDVLSAAGFEAAYLPREHSEGLTLHVFTGVLRG